MLQEFLRHYARVKYGLSGNLLRNCRMKSGHDYYKKETAVVVNGSKEIFEMFVAFVCLFGSDFCFARLMLGVC